MGLLCCADDGLCFVHTRNAPAAAATVVVVVVDVVAVHKPGNLARAPRTHRPNVVCIHVYVPLPCALCGWLAGLARARIRWRRWLCLLAGLAWLVGYADCAAATECENVYVLRDGYAAVHCRSRAGLYVVHARSSRVHRVYMRV